MRSFFRLDAIPTAERPCFSCRSKYQLLVLEHMGCDMASDVSMETLQAATLQVLTELRVQLCCPTAAAYSFLQLFN